MKKLLVISILALLLVPTVLAFFPNSHYNTIRESLKTEQSTEFYNVCKKHTDLCYAGNMLSDVSVFWYYTKFVRYKVTHTPALCTKLLEKANTEEEKACAIGGCSHQTADLVSHTKMVPGSIKSMFLQNALIHPFVEQKLDLYVEKNNPDVNFDSLTSVESFNTCKPLFLRVMAADDAYLGESLDDKFDQFIIEVAGSQGDTGYDASFRKLFIVPQPVLIVYFGIMALLTILVSMLWYRRLRFPSRRTSLNWFTFVVALTLLLFMGYLAYQFTQGNSFDTFTSVLARPLSNLVPLADTEQAYLNDAQDRTDKLFAIGESAIFNTDASGEFELAGADADIINIQYTLIFIIIGLISFILYRNFRSVQPRGLGFGGL